MGLWDTLEGQSPVSEALPHPAPSSCIINACGYSVPRPVALTKGEKRGFVTIILGEKNICKMMMTLMSPVQRVSRNQQEKWTKGLEAEGRAFSEYTPLSTPNDSSQEPVEQEKVARSGNDYSIRYEISISPAGSDGQRGHTGEMPA